MLDLKDKNILVLAPHTDDETVGCGGFIHRAHNQGANVIFIAFSWCYKPELIDEFHNACTTLTPLSDDNNHIFNFKVRKFPSQRQEILEELIKLKRYTNPILSYVTLALMSIKIIIQFIMKLKEHLKTKLF